MSLLRKILGEQSCFEPQDDTANELQVHLQYAAQPNCTEGPLMWFPERVQPTPPRTKHAASYIPNWAGEMGEGGEDRGGRGVGLETGV